MSNYIVTQTTDPAQTTICSNAKVGIGTTSPGCSLDINVPNSGTPTMLALSNSGGGYADVAEFDYNASSSPYPLTLSLKHSRPFIISGGNVGIGTTAPSYPLDVHYNGSSDSIAVNGVAQVVSGHNHLGYGGNFVGGHVGVHGEASVEGDASDTSERIGGEFFGQGGSNNFGIKVTVNGSANTSGGNYIAGWFYADAEDSSGDFYCGYFEGPEKVYVGGNLGINQKTPASKLHIGNDENNTGYITMEELSADASAPAANKAALFVRDNGSGKTQLCVRFNTGAIQVIATQP